MNYELMISEPFFDFFGLQVILRDEASIDVLGALAEVLRTLAWTVESA